MADLCSEIICPSKPTTLDISGDGHNKVSHSKDRDFHMIVGGVTIPLQVRHRRFSIGYQESWSWSGLYIVIADDGVAYECGTKIYSGDGAISEDATIMDSELFYVDHVNGIAIWRELTKHVTFSQTTTKLAMFRVPFGTFYAHWFEVRPNIETTEEWCILVNGVKEVVETNYSVEQGAVINILWPLPPSLAMAVPDPELCPPAFYDYNAGGPGGDMQLAELDGGKDFYYPEWLRDLGLHKEIDAEEAAERFATYFFHDYRPSTSILNLPQLGFARPMGNAAKDAEGNILLSCKTTNKTVNRLYLAGEDKTIIDLNTTGILEGEGLKLYPVGII